MKNLIPKKIRKAALKTYSGLFDKQTYFPLSILKDKEFTALKCTVAYNKFGGYCVPMSSRDRDAAKKILANDVYEPKTIDFMYSNCGDGDVVHAGTYFGDFLPALSKGSGTDSKIWAFEPNPENYRCARITLEINNITNVVLTNAGLGAEEGSLFIKTTDENGRSLGGASKIIGQQKNENNGGLELVKIVTIDDMINVNRDISIIQLDVEGHEKEALAGALKTIQRCLPIIILEVLPNSTLLESKWFSENILSLGYKKTNELHRNSVFSHST